MQGALRRWKTTALGEGMRLTEQRMMGRNPGPGPPPTSKAPPREQVRPPRSPEAEDPKNWMGAGQNGNFSPESPWERRTAGPHTPFRNDTRPRPGRAGPRGPCAEGRPCRTLTPELLCGASFPRPPTGVPAPVPPPRVSPVGHDAHTCHPRGHLHPPPHRRLTHINGLSAPAPRPGPPLPVSKG